MSHPTVSRALRGEGRISDETRERVVAIAQDLGYTPNLVARGLVMQRTRSIGLVVTNIGDPFHAEIINGVEHVAQTNEYSLFLGSTTASPDQEVRMVRSFHARNVDGIIIAAGQFGDRYAEVLDEIDMPIVLISTHSTNDALHSVTHDDYGGAGQIMAHLLDQGCRRIAYLGHFSGGRVDSERRDAWLDALKQANLTPPVTVDVAVTTIDAGMNAVGPLLDKAERQWGQPPDAIFCYNDLLAIGVLSGLRQRGLRVPNDIAVAGFDGLEVTAHLDPPLTTMCQPRYAMGIRATEILLDLLANNATAPPHEVQLRGELLIRKSTMRGA
ncbi:MAG: LacI family DNA-binding transcriptional regulator [Caldilineaceae bacterium]|nr:LacI family DNA-binding transcriptional regulator [Caldilineaceae bacterium]